MNVYLLLSLLALSFRSECHAAWLFGNLDQTKTEAHECPDAFNCGNGKCIQLSWLCDGDNDCGNNEDEDRNNCRLATAQPDPLQWKTVSQEVNANQNSSITLECKLTDSRRIKWTFNGNPLFDGEAAALEKERISVSASGSKSTISIHGIQVDDSGVYGCDVDGLPRLQHTVKVFGWITDGVAKALPLGASFSLQCHLSGPGTVIWTQNSDALGFGDILFDTKKNNRYVLSEVTHGSQFNVTDAQKEDSGIYTCRATDIPDLTHVISILNPPHLEVACAGKLASLRWDDHKEGLINDIILQRSRRQRDEWQTLKILDGNSTDTTEALIVRDQHFRIVLKDSLGFEWVSNTAPDNECSAPQDVPLSNPKDVHAFLSEEGGIIKIIVYWTIVPEDQWMSDGFHYILHYKEESTDEWTQVKIDDPTQYKYQIDIPLNKTSTYITKVQSGNKLGLCRTDPSYVQVNSVSEHEKNGLTLPGFITKSQVIPALINSEVLLECEHETTHDYAFAWSKQPSSTPLVAMGYSLTPDSRFHPEGTNLRISNVMPSDGGTYVCEVKMNPIATLSHVVIVGKTLDITNVSLTCKPNEPRAIISWTYCMGEYRTRHWGERCIKYIGLEDYIEEQLKPFEYVVIAQSAHTGANVYVRVNSTSVEIKLRPGSSYAIKVASRNIYGESSFTNDLLHACNTAEDIPWRNPTHVTLSRNSSLIIVFWEELESYEQHGEGFAYKVTYSTGNSTFKSNVSSSGFKITEFDPDLTYTITVTSLNNIGDCNETAIPVISYPQKVTEMQEDCFSSLYSAENKNITITARIGGNASLPCENKGNSSIMWRRRPSHEIVTINEVTYLDTTRLSSDVSGNLNIREIQDQDYGYYECVTFQDTHVTTYIWNLVREE